MHNRLTNRSLFFYGLADLPVMLTTIPMAIWLSRFYTGDMGLGLAAVANIMLISRLFDVITDPIVGYLSDHTRSRWGRRRSIPRRCHLRARATRTSRPVSRRR